MVDRALNRFRISGFAELPESSPFMQDIPDDFADPVSDGPDRLNVSESDHQAFENRLEVAAVGSGSGLGRLTEHAPEEPISFRGSAGMVFPRAFIGAGADTDPGG